MNPGQSLPQGPRFHANGKGPYAGIDDRTRLVAKKVADFLKESGDRFQKSIVFCVHEEHAARMRQALVNERRHEEILFHDPRLPRATAHFADKELGPANRSSSTSPRKAIPSRRPTMRRRQRPRARTRCRWNRATTKPLLTANRPTSALRPPALRNG